MYWPVARLVEVVHVAVLFKICFVWVMGSICCGAPSIAQKLISSPPQFSVMDKGKAVKTAVF